MRKKYQKIAKEICSEAIIFARVSSESFLLWHHVYQRRVYTAHLRAAHF